jgi:hypothetical protein
VPLMPPCPLVRRVPLMPPCPLVRRVPLMPPALTHPSTTSLRALHLYAWTTSWNSNCKQCGAWKLKHNTSREWNAVHMYLLRIWQWNTSL